MSLLKSTIENWFQKKKKKEKQNSRAWLGRPLMRWDDVSTVVLLIDRESLSADLPQEQLIITPKEAEISAEYPDQTAHLMGESLQLVPPPDILWWLHFIFHLTPPKRLADRAALPQHIFLDVTDSHQSFTHTSRNKCALSFFIILLKDVKFYRSDWQQHWGYGCSDQSSGSWPESSCWPTDYFPWAETDHNQGPFAWGICLILGFCMNPDWYFVLKSHAWIFDSPLTCLLNQQSLLGKPISTFHCGNLIAHWAL